MIVRIATEGQYRFPGAHLDRIKELDGRIVEAVANEDEAQFHKLLRRNDRHCQKSGRTGSQ